MSRVSKNIIYNLFGQGLTLIFSLVAVKYIFKQLGEEALGILYFSQVLNIILYGVLQKGILTTSVREISTHFNNKTEEYIRDFIQTGSLLCWGIYILFGIGIYFIAPILVEKWINLKTVDSVAATRILRILGIASLVAFPRSFYASLINGLQRMEFNNLINVATVGLQQLGTILILKSGGNLFHITYWYVVCYGIGTLAYFPIVTHFFTLEAFIPRYSPYVVKRNLRFASKLTYISILALIHKQFDKVIVSKLLSIGLFGYYNFIYHFVSKTSLVTNAIAQAAFPSFSALFKADDRRSLLLQYRKLQDLINFFTIPMFALGPFAALPLVTYVFDKEIAMILLLPIFLLSLGFYLNGALNILYKISLAVGKPEIAVRTNIYALFVVLPAVILLIYFFKLTGAALSWVFFNLFVCIYAVPRICAECLSIQALEWYLRLIKVFILTGFTYGAAWITVRFFNIYSIFSLSLAYIAASIIFLIGAYLMISNELRETLLKYIQVLLNKLKFEPESSSIA